MRLSTVGLSIGTALLLTSVGLAEAQAQKQPPAPPAGEPAEAVTSIGTVDFGGRFESTTGDVARLERFRDLRNGANVNFEANKEADGYWYAVTARNIGYRDGLYTADYARRKMRVSFLFDQTPLNYSYISQTPWVTSVSGETATLSLDPAARLAVQNRVPGVVGVPQNPAQLATPSIYRGLATQFDLRQRRDTLGVNLTYEATRALNAVFSVNSYKRTGAMPYGASFAFNVADEVPVPLQNRTTDFNAGVEWATPKAMLRVAWDGSWFNNDIQALVWDNPFRATDFSTFPGTGYDPSGYSNGNGPAQGRLALPPSNNMNVVSATGLVKLPSRSTLNGTVSVTSMKQDEALIPFTINSVINRPAVLAQFPGIAQPGRSTAEADVRGINANLNFTTRPTRVFGLTARYRFNDHKNRTPTFDGREYVRFDAVPEETGGETEHFDITRNTLDVNASFDLMRYTSLRVGYGLDSFDRTGRSFSNMTDNAFRASVDTIGTQFFTVRALYEYTRRSGSGFSEDAIEDGGSQGGLRFYDEADRNSNRGTVIVTLTPVQMVDLDLWVGAGKDTYKGPGHEFGLLNNDNKSINVGVTVTPTDRIALGVNYGRETFSSNQKSRNANPPADPTAVPPVAPSDYGSFFDPNRDWTLDNDEKVNTVSLFVNLTRAIANTEIRAGYDYSDSNQAFVHGGPRITELSTNTPLSGPSAIVYPGFAIPLPCGAGVASCFIGLPDVTNKWHRLSLDVRYFLTRSVGVGAAWWYEKLEVSDFNTVDTNGPVGVSSASGAPRIDYLGEINTGYGNRPYRAHTGFVRVFYVF